MVEFRNMDNIDKRILGEVYFSVDGEFDGSHPPKHSMLSVGVVAFTLEDGIIGEFSRNLLHLSRQNNSLRSSWLSSLGFPTDHTMDISVWIDFWSKHPEAFAATQRDQVSPNEAMSDFLNFYSETVKKVGKGMRDGVFIEYPGGIDYFWCHWYFMEYLGEDPFGHSRSMSMKSYAAASKKKAFCHSTKRNLPKSWFSSKIKHTHIALDDARGQAHQAIRMMCEHLEIDLPPL